MTLNCTLHVSQNVKRVDSSRFRSVSHGMVTPGGQGGEFLLSALVDGPTPGLEEACQVLAYSLGEGLSVQVHLFLVAAGEVAHLMVTCKHLLQGSPAKLLLQLHA